MQHRIVVAVVATMPDFAATSLSREQPNTAHLLPDELPAVIYDGGASPSEICERKSTRLRLAYLVRL
jgi:hypothetical protein